MKKPVLVMALLALTHAVAYAHTELSASMPADKATLEAAPKELMLHFSEPVKLTTVTNSWRSAAESLMSRVGRC